MSQNDANHSEDSLARSARTTAAATIWVALFTVVLASVSFCQLREMKSGSEDTKRLAAAALANARAWIVVKGTGFQYRVDEKRVPRVRAVVALTNTGPTPARNVHATVCGQVRTSEPTLDEYQIGTQACVLQSFGLLGKEISATFNQDDILEEVPPGSLASSTHDPGRHYYVWGNIEYNISATEQGSTIFCLLSGPDGAQLGACVTGNDAR